MSKDENMARRAEAMELVKALIDEECCEKDRESLTIALKDMEHMQEVTKYGTELDMVIAHHKQSVLEHEKMIREHERLMAYLKGEEDNTIPCIGCQMLECVGKSSCKAFSEWLGGGEK